MTGWAILGWLGIVIAVSVLPLARLDPVLSGFAAMTAIVLAGLVSLRSYVFAAITISISVVSALILCHHNAQGFVVPTTRPLSECGVLFAAPLAIAFLFIAIAYARKRKS